MHALRCERLLDRIEHLSHPRRRVVGGRSQGDGLVEQVLGALLFQQGHQLSAAAVFAAQSFHSLGELDQGLLGECGTRGIRHNFSLTAVI